MPSLEQSYQTPCKCRLGTAILEFEQRSWVTKLQLRWCLRQMPQYREIFRTANPWVLRQTPVWAASHAWLSACIRKVVRSRGFLFALALSAGTLQGGTVTSVAGISGWGYCPPDQTNLPNFTSFAGPPLTLAGFSTTTSGETLSSVAVSCTLGGVVGSSSVTAQFASLASNSLSMDLRMSTPLLAGNFYANGSAGWVEELIVTGGTGGGWLSFRFSDSVSLPTVIGYNCSATFNGVQHNLELEGCRVGERILPFTFGVPLSVSLSISAFAFADGDSNGALNSRTQWTDSLSSIGVYPTGAEVQFIPEPTSWQLTLLGLLPFAYRHRIPKRIRNQQSRG